MNTDPYKKKRKKPQKKGVLANTKKTVEKKINNLCKGIHDAILGKKKPPKKKKNTNPWD